jgi:hypothetical protein
MKDGKELGRIVEYGKTGYWDKELAAIINEKNSAGLLILKFNQLVFIRR